jgi:hypothetical protein
MKLSDLKGKYWHKLTDKEIEVLKKKKATVGWGLKNLKQPDWCGYPDALCGGMGCWSLVDHEIRKKISRKFCAKEPCDCYKKA